VADLSRKSVYGPVAAIRRTTTAGIIAIARLLMPVLVLVAGDRCWRCGVRITPTRNLSVYHIVEARIWAWNEVICDGCIRQGRGSLHH
jgi:hypothetical protein